MKRHQRRMQTLSTTQGRRNRPQRVGSPHQGRSEVAVEGRVDAVRGGKPPKTVLTVVPVPAGALGWLVTHNVVVTLGLALIVGLVVIGVVWHIVREETRQVELREKGATDRLQICHHSERVLAETHRLSTWLRYLGPARRPPMLAPFARMRARRRGSSGSRPAWRKLCVSRVHRSLTPPRIATTGRVLPAP